jgi:hypothetical protein
MTPSYRVLPFLLVFAAAALLVWPGAAWSDAGALKRLRSTLPGELSARHLTVLGMRVGDDGLAALQGRVGQAVAFSPEAAPELVTTCYVDEEDDSLAVVFQAHRRDPYRRLTMAYIGGPRGFDRGTRRCQPMSGLAASAATASGLYLGMSRETFAAQFPHPPSERSPRLLGYYFFQPIESGCQLLSGVRGQFDATGLTAVTVYRLYRGARC